MKFIARAAFAGACILGLTGLSFPTQLKPVTNPPRVYTFVDQRPGPSLKSGLESYMVTNCAYGIWRLGDMDIDPHLPLLLDAMLAQRFGDKLAGRTVTLHAFLVHLNTAADQRGSVAAFTGPGILAGALNDQNKVGCAPADLRGGYLPSEVPAGASPIIATIDLDIDGRHFQSRAIAPSPVVLPPNRRADAGKHEAWNAAVESVVDASLNALGDRIAAELFAPQPASAGSATHETAAGQ